MRNAAVLALLGLAACGGNQVSPVPEPRWEGCTTNGFVEVMNDWNRELEVYAYTADASTGTLLGSVRPSQTSEFLMPHDAVRAAVMQPALSGPIPLPSRARSVVRMRYLCR